MIAPDHIRVPRPLVWAGGIALAALAAETAAIALWLSQPVGSAKCDKQGQSPRTNSEGRCSNADLVFGERSFDECAEAEREASEADGSKGRPDTVSHARPVPIAAESQGKNGTEDNGEQADDGEAGFHANTLTHGGRESIA